VPSSQPTSQWLCALVFLGARVRPSIWRRIPGLLAYSRAAASCFGVQLRGLANSLAACVRSGTERLLTGRHSSSGMGFHNKPPSVSQAVTLSDIFLSDDTTNLAATAISSSRCTQLPHPLPLFITSHRHPANPIGHPRVRNSATDAVSTDSILVHIALLTRLLQT
jgi:hypothetical protein